MSIFYLVLIFGVVVLVHEAGHCIAAKKCGIFVEEFSIGMGPKLFGKQYGETIYSLRLLPLGGSCKMLGEDGESTNKRAFGNKPVYQRMIVILAGVFMNLILAIIFFFILIGFSGFILPSVSSIKPDSAAEAAGILPGDQFIKMNGSRIVSYEDFKFMIGENKAKPMELDILRDGKEYKYTVTPFRYDIEGNLLPEDAEVNESEVNYQIGFYAQQKSGLFSEAIDGMEKADLWETAKSSYNTTVFYVKTTFKVLFQLVTLQRSPDELMGMVGFGNYVAKEHDAAVEYTTENDKSYGLVILSMMSFIPLLSTNLAVFNILPIPALDGGRFLFLLYELIRKKPLKPEVENMIHMVGFVLLMILAVVITFKDIINII